MYFFGLSNARTWEFSTFHCDSAVAVVVLIDVICIEWWFYIIDVALAHANNSCHMTPEMSLGACLMDRENLVWKFPWDFRSYTFDCYCWFIFRPKATGWIFYYFIIIERRGWKKRILIKSNWIKCDDITFCLS